MKIKLNFDVQPEPGDCLTDNIEGTGNIYVVDKEGYLNIASNKKSNCISLNKNTILYKVCHAVINGQYETLAINTNYEFTIL